MSVVTTILVALALTACQSASSPAQQQAQRGATVTLGFEESAMFDDRLELQFVGVLEDTRCPSDVDCVWAGEVKVRLAIRIDAGKATSQDVIAGQSVSADSYRITVIEVGPEPVSDRKIAPADYTVVIKAE